MAKRSPEERFWAKVDKNGPVPAHRPELGPCWLWKTTHGGRHVTFRVEGRQVHAYRYAHELLVGPVPEGLVPDHLCRVRACVKPIADEDGPAHLELVTNRENVLRGEGPSARNARKTHCKRGHPFDTANTHVDPRGGRTCRACKRQAVHDRGEAARRRARRAARRGDGPEPYQVAGGMARAASAKRDQGRFI
jgi:hypothetical protein